MVNEVLATEGVMLFSGLVLVLGIKDRIMHHTEGRLFHADSVVSALISRGQMYKQCINTSDQPNQQNIARLDVLPINQ